MTKGEAEDDDVLADGGVALDAIAVPEGAIEEDITVDREGEEGDQAAAKGKKKTVVCLTREVQAFIVAALAQYSPQTVVVRLVKERFGIVVSRQRVAHYDVARGGLQAAIWKEYYAKVREQHLERMANAARTSHQEVRLFELHRLFERAKRRGDDVRAASVLKQIAEEAGGVFTARREITGKDGAPVLGPGIALYVDGVEPDTGFFLDHEEDDPGGPTKP